MTPESPLGLFRRACGLVEPMALTCQGPDAPDDAPRVVSPPGPFLLIGRHPREDLSLDDRQVSRRHAYVQAVAGRVVVLDLKSRRKTFWGEETEPRPWGWLDPGQSIRIGPFRITRTDRPPEVLPPLLDLFSAPEDPGWVLDQCPRPAFELPFRVGGVPSTWAMPGLLALVGRTDDCQFILADDSVSRTHACLVRTPLGTWVVDVGVREGVHVNGTRVRWAWLADGDLVRFGRFTMVLRYDRPPEGIARADVPLEAGSFPSGSVDEELYGLDPDDEGQRMGLAVRPPSRPPGLIPRPGAAPAPTHPSAVPAGFAGGEWEPAFGAVPSPYAMWQQQMQLMETFHKDMVMMVQMFIAMHREFQGSVREELKRVQQLTRELNRLTARLDRLPGPAENGPSAKAARPEEKPRPSRGEASSGPAAAPQPRPSPPPRGPSGLTPAGRDAEPGGEPQATTPPEDPAQDGAGQAPRKESSEMYADLTRRISELQRERRGYWQKILKNING